MNREDILTLAKAGFTAQQIAALSAVEQKQPEQQPQPQPQQSLDEIMQEISGLNKNIQAAMLQGSTMPGSAQPETAEQILASIINPPKKEG